jgi:hypothetical protein
MRQTHAQLVKERDLLLEMCRKQNDQITYLSNLIMSLDPTAWSQLARKQRVSTGVATPTSDDSAFGTV